MTRTETAVFDRIFDAFSNSELNQIADYQYSDFYKICYSVGDVDLLPSEVISVQTNLKILVS